MRGRGILTFGVDSDAQKQYLRYQRRITTGRRLKWVELWCNSLILSLFSTFWCEAELGTLQESASVVVLYKTGMKVSASSGSKKV